MKCHVMNKKIILRNHKNLEENLERIIKYGLEIIKPSRTSPYIDIDKDERAIIIEGLFLRACAVWEKFLETEVVLLAYMDTTRLLDEFQLPMQTGLSQKVIKSMIFSNLFRDFNDIERSKGLFRAFIVDDYNLFESLTTDQLKKIGIVYKLRNYIAHYSEFAKKKLLQEYAKTYKISKFKEPGSFLIKNSGMYYEKLIHNFCLASSKMKAKLNNIKA